MRKIVFDTKMMEIRDALVAEPTSFYDASFEMEKLRLQQLTAAQAEIVRRLGKVVSWVMTMKEHVRRVVKKGERTLGMRWELLIAI